MKSNLDKFYTNDNVAKQCIELADKLYPLEAFDMLLEPSCGNGSFVKYLPKKQTVCMDLSPEVEDALIMDFYDYEVASNKRVLTIGNPPFGIGGKEAVKFFNHAASFSTVIAFIVPRTFKRVSIQNRLSLNFQLQYEEDIPVGSFDPSTMKAKCVFQIWEKQNTLRSKVVLANTHKDFIFTKDLSKATIALKAYGGTGDCGRIEYDFSELNPKAYHFIICDENVVDTFKKLEYYPLASNTVRQDSIGQKEIIYLYKKYLRSVI